MDANKFGGFVSAWMQLPAKTRKALSHSGAVVSREGDPCHYVYPITKQQYFDPGNYVYAQALALMCPRLMSEVNWNTAMKGDICEGIMGAYFEEKHILPPDAPSRKLFHPGFGRELEVVCAIVDFFAWHTNNVQREVGVNALHHWVDWIIAVAKSCSRPRPIVEQDEKTIPRQKTVGHLLDVIH